MERSMTLQTLSILFVQCDGMESDMRCFGYFRGWHIFSDVLLSLPHCTSKSTVSAGANDNPEREQLCNPSNIVYRGVMEGKVTQGALQICLIDFVPLHFVTVYVHTQSAMQYYAKKYMLLLEHLCLLYMMMRGAMDMEHFSDLALFSCLNPTVALADTTRFAE